MSEYANIRFPRADITSTDHVTFSNKMQNVTLPYGSPLTYASNSWYRDTYTDYNHFFVNGIYGMQQGKWYHVGPYYGDTGIGVDNNPDSVNLGKIQLKLTAGTNITITDGNNNDKVISAVSSNDILVCTATLDDLTGKYIVTGLTPEQIVNAYTNNQLVICKVTDMGQYFYLSYAISTSRIAFCSVLHGSDEENLIYDGPTYGTWSLNVRIREESWYVYNVTDGTSQYDVIVSERQRHLIIDNSANTQSVTLNFIVNPNSSMYLLNNYAVNYSSRSVEAGSVAMVDTMILNNDSIYYEIKPVIKNPH